MALFRRGTRTASAVAFTEVDVLILKKKALERVLDEYPETRRSFEDLAEHRLAHDGDGGGSGALCDGVM